MKNIAQTVLLCITILCVGLMVGILLGKNTATRPVTLSAYDKISQDESSQSASSGNDAVGKININSATADELSMLPGIGSTYANRIIEYRLNNGNFNTIEELMNVKGIGTGRFDAIKNYITVGG